VTSRSGGEIVSGASVSTTVASIPAPAKVPSKPHTSICRVRKVPAVSCTVHPGPTAWQTSKAVRSASVSSTPDGATVTVRVAASKVWAAAMDAADPTKKLNRTRPNPSERRMVVPSVATLRRAP
jgi:hypothetical protein